MNRRSKISFILLSIVFFSVLFVGCTRELQTAIGCDNPGILKCKDRVVVSEEAKETSALLPANGKAQAISSIAPQPGLASTDISKYDYMPGTPSWVPLIDACMARGGQRISCIEALPPKELKKLEAWEIAQRCGRDIRFNSSLCSSNSTSLQP